MKAPVFTKQNSALRQVVFAATFVLLALVAKPAKALEGFYLGGQLGHVALGTPSNSSSLGFGVDLGFRTTSPVDLVISYFRVSDRGLGIHMPTLSGEFHVGHAYDFDFTIGAGPGFYNYSVIGVDETKFGLQFGGAVDFLIDEHFRVGLGTRYHLPFGNGVLSSNIWTVTMRAGYLFTTE